MAAGKGEKADEEKGARALEKGAMTPEKEEMGVKAVDEKGAMAAEKGQMGVEAADEEKGAKGATTADKGQIGVETAHEEKGETGGKAVYEKGVTTTEKGQMGLETTDKEKREMGGKVVYEKGAMATKKGQMGLEIADEEKGETGVKAVDEKRVTAAEKGQMGVKAADQEKGAWVVEKEEMRVKIADEKGAIAAEKGQMGVEAANEEKGARMIEKAAKAVEKGEKEKEKEDTAAGTEGAGKKAVFFFSAAVVGKVITLVSSKGHLFRMSEAAARLSVVLADMIDKGCANGKIPLPNVDNRALTMVIKYCEKHAAAELGCNHGAADEGDNSGVGANTTACKKLLYEWDRKFLEDITKVALFDLITAADYLNIKGLLDAGCQKVADMIKKKTPAQVRSMFNIVNDFTAEEEEEIRRQSPWVFDEYKEASDDEEV